MTVATLQTAWFGANPFSVDLVPATGNGLSGQILPQFKLGSVSYGDSEAEYVYCKYTSVSNLVLQPGLAFHIDDDFTATIVTTSASPRGNKIGVCAIGMGNYGASYTTVTGTVYYLWLARSGQFPIAYTTVATVGNLAETTATAGTLNYPNTATTSSKLITGSYVTKAVGTTFSGTTVSGSKLVTVLPGAITLGSGPVWIGATLSATGIASSQTIASFGYTQGDVITSLTLSANASASGTVTITPSLLAESRVYWPYIDKTN